MANARKGGDETPAHLDQKTEPPKLTARATRARQSTKSSRAKTKSPSRTRAPRVSAEERALRAKVIETARRMSDSGLSPGRSGNVSVRFGAGMLITPSGMPYEALQPSDVVFVGLDGEVPEGALKPSSEWQFHLSALSARPDRAAVVHTHSENAVVLACRHEPIPAFHYMVAAAGGVDIPCIPYATFGTKKLARLVAKGLVERDAVLMANHGQLALGKSLSGALELAGEVETLAAQYVKVLTLGKPQLLSAKEMRTVLKRFQSYGQNAQAPAEE